MNDKTLIHPDDDGYGVGTGQGVVPATTRLGYRNPEVATGPWTSAAANPATTDKGGILDRAIVGTLPDGRRVAIGELWAMGPVEDSQRASLDVEAHLAALGIAGDPALKVGA